MMSRIAVRSIYRLRMRPAQVAWIATKPRFEPAKNPYDQYVQHAVDSQDEKYTHRVINSEGNIAPLDESHGMPQHSHPEALVPREKPDSLEETQVFPKAELERQWQWSVAEEMLPVADYDRSSQILDEVGRMEVWMDSVADRVKTVKSKLDDMEEEGGVILHLKDSK